MSKRRKKKANVYEIITERILTLLDEGTVPWHKPWKGRGAGGMPRNLVSGHVYRGINIFMLLAAGFESPYFLTFNQAKKKGGSVRKGEKGLPVVFWKWLEKEEERDDGSKETKRVPFLRYYTVFNVSQCDGIEDPSEPVPEPENDFDPIAACEAVVEGWSDRPDITHGGGSAYYKPSTDSIRMPKPEGFDSSEAYYSTLFHELTHSTGHRDRLGRPGITDAVMFGSHSYSREELVAEMGAAFLSGFTGIEDKTLDNSAAYIANWKKKLTAEPKCVVIAAAQAQKAADAILGAKLGEASVSDDEEPTGNEEVQQEAA